MSLYPSARLCFPEIWERMGVTNALAVSAYPDQLAAQWPAYFDAVLVDAPCSGEGMFRRHPETREEWSPEAPAGCAKRQREILAAAARLVRPGGRMVYSTCTLNTMENEENISWFLTEHSDFSVCPFQLPGVDGTAGMATLFPHRVRGEGHFLALLVSKGKTWKPVLHRQACHKPMQCACGRCRHLPAGSIRSGCTCWEKHWYPYRRRVRRCGVSACCGRGFTWGR